MAHIEKQRELSSAVRRPDGPGQSRTFARKGDAERFLREVESDGVACGSTRAPDMPLAIWAEDSSSSPPLADDPGDVWRDLDKYVLPRFGDLPHRSAASRRDRDWLNDESPRHRTVVGAPPLPLVRRMLQVAVEKERWSPTRVPRPPPRVPARDGVPRLGRLDPLAEAHPARGPGADLPRRRQRDALERAHRSAARPIDLRRRKIRVTDSSCGSDRSCLRRKEPKTLRHPVDHPLAVHGGAPRDHLDLHADPGPDDWSSRTVPATRCRHRASSRTTSKRPKRPRECPAGSTTSATRASPSRSPRALTRRRSKPGWATPRSTSRSTATATSFPELDEAIALAFDQGWTQARAAAGVA